MEYQVPQFIEVESKVVGPLTLKQFIYLAGGLGLCVVLFHFLPFFIAVLACIPVAAFAAALAFYKVNNKPFISVVEAAFHFYTSARLFLWHKEPVRPKPSAQETIASPSAAQPHTARLTSSKLHELAWSLDIQDRNNATIENK